MTKKDWKKEAYSYMGQCLICVSPRIMIKGSFARFGIGIYICTGCDYAYPQKFKPTKVDFFKLSWQ